MENPERDRPDPVFRNARREGAIALAVWAACLIWGVGFCAISGYDPPEGAVPTVLGMPRWIFIGVLVPWFVATVFTLVYSLRIMKDDDLGGDGE